MGLVTPSAGTIFWMVIIFGVVVFILGKFAWKPILNALREREEAIRDALNSAELARRQIGDLKAEQDLIRAEAVRDKEQILREARDIRDQMISEAREKAGQESAKLMAQLRDQMENEKNMALDEIKQQVAELSVKIAETILREKLDNTPSQEKIISAQLEEFKLN
ncbi:MAG: F0F1 ATP synthase subunit B [Prolixibacteraceae bacterium]|nr:F0F1 ATP synthase subunit B [Bacteroidales bacterium]OQB80726.1 MAG: ATP synthase subunit b [Bacteroidetes bacterium ADurb.Bin123]HNU78563.1 F0F1 ATP synthase subunit B [Prolixibacteraceae bacterium]HNZ67888.1 F0F1 ATP synthase subunit B [Prolixibacteraceae bacterium]HOC85288.1 F0F1 ATP synthase subunit B [Prolixibacteraceae bacterium]